MNSFQQVLTADSYSRQIEMNFGGCDRWKRVRVGTLLSLAADAAGFDYDARGLPHEKLLELGEAFLLSRAAIRIHDCPHFRDVLEVKTWENGIHGAHMQRVYEFRDLTGRFRVSIKSDWILIDVHNRRILRPTEFKAKPISSCSQSIDCPETKKILPPRKNIQELGTRQIRWSDLDGNGHLYSGNYGNIFWDYLPENLQDRIPREFFINYHKEISLGQVLTLTGALEESEQPENFEDYRMAGTGPEGTCFTALARF